MIASLSRAKNDNYYSIEGGSRGGRNVKRGEQKPSFELKKNVCMSARYLIEIRVVHAKEVQRNCLLLLSGK